MGLSGREESTEADCAVGGGGTVTRVCLGCEQELKHTMARLVVARTKADRVGRQGCTAMVFASVRLAPCSRRIRRVFPKPCARLWWNAAARRERLRHSNT